MGIGIIRKNHLLLGAAAVLTMGGAAVIMGITGSPLADFLLPLLTYAFLLSLWRTFRLLRSSARRKEKLRLASFYIIHAGVALIIFGAVFNTTLTSQRDLVFRFVPGEGIVGGPQEVGAGYAVEVAGINVYENYEGYMTTEVLVRVYKEGRYVGEGVAKTINNLKFGRVTKVYINRNLDADVYVIFQGIGGHAGGVIEVPLTVKLEPFVNFLWLGIALISAGIIPALIIEGFSPHGAEEKKRVRR
jgi:cytochrome c biogenesis factor